MNLHRTTDPEVHSYCRSSTTCCKENRCELTPEPAVALYVHVPFCLAKCRYCDFYSLPLSEATADIYVEAALRELAGNLECLKVPLSSAYLGGGTPTVLGPELLRRLLGAVGPLVSEQTEFSVEANPGTVSRALADTLIDCRVNRVTLGAQSFQRGELDTLGRAHGPDQTAVAVQVLRDAGLDNVGLDLIYGIPGQTPGTWRESLGTALRLQPEHISCYALSFEDNTPLREDLLNGRVAEMEDSLQRECYQAAIEMTRSAGMEHYEISNFARPGRRCANNTTYWLNQSYLGIGPAAASYIQGTRRTNAPDVYAYVQAILGNQPAPATRETLTPRMSMAETLMLGLRLVEGVDRKGFTARFDRDPLAAFPRSMTRHLRLGSLIVTDSHIRICPDFLFVADSILADILAEAAS